MLALIIFQLIGPKARIFHPRKKKSVPVCRDDEMYAASSYSESEDEITNVDNSEYLIYAMLLPCGTLM